LTELFSLQRKKKNSDVITFLKNSSKWFAQALVDLKDQCPVLKPKYPVA